MKPIIKEVPEKGGRWSQMIYCINHIHYMCVYNRCDLYSKICPRFNSLLIFIFYGTLFFSCRLFSLHFSSAWILILITTLWASQFSLLFQAPHVMSKLSKLSHIIWLFLHFSTVISSQAVFCCPSSVITSLQNYRMLLLTASSWLHCSEHHIPY